MSRGIDKAAGAKREVVGDSPYAARKPNGSAGVNSVGLNATPGAVITAPATPAARQWQGWGTALKPAWEPIVLARKPLAVPREAVEEEFYDADRPEVPVIMRGATVAENVLQWGTGAINVDGCRVDMAGEVVRTGQGTSDSIYGGGNGLRPSDMGTQQFTSHALGRWPANIVHDGSDEVVAAFPDAGGGHGGGRRLTRSDYRGGGEADGSAPHSFADSGSAARFFYCAKASRKDREEGLSTGSGRANTHPTVKPTDLMRWLCRLVTPPGGVVLDPFLGSGSTGKAALLEGFRFIGIEREDEYMPIAAARIGWAAGRMDKEDAQAATAAPAAPAAPAVVPQQPAANDNEPDLFSAAA